MKRRQRGFTIIETTLALAIAGLLAATVLVGMGRSIGQTRYTDAVNQALDFFQGQYDATTNTINDRSSAETCDNTGISTQTAPQSTQPVGASNCLLLGNLITSTDGQNMTVSQVLALVDPSSATGEASKTDEAILADSHIIKGNNASTYAMEWGARLLQPGTQNTQPFAMMVVRVPISGTIETYTTTNSGVYGSFLTAGTGASLVGLANTENKVGLKLCIDPSSTFGIGMSPMGIAIASNAADTSGVQTIAAGGC